jgi:hypothetical protein
VDGEYQGMTPFQLAIILGEEEIVDYLLQHGNINFLKLEPLNGDSTLLLAIRCSGYTHILNSIISHLESLYETSLRKLQKILALRNYKRENAFSLIICTNVTNKAAVLNRLLAIGLKPVWVPFESSGEYNPQQLRTNPLYALYWKKEWESFFMLDSYFPELTFSSIESAYARPERRRFGFQSVITKILEPDTIDEFRDAVREYGIINLFFWLICIPLDENQDEGQILPQELIDAQSSDGYTPLDIVSIFASNSMVIEKAQRMGLTR